MGLFSKLFGKKSNKKEINTDVIKENDNSEPVKADIINVANEDEKMNWAMEKSRLTLHYFEDCLKSPKPYQQYFSIKVKIVDAGNVEHLWLNEPSFDDEGNLYGVVGNEPVYVNSVSINQKIGIDRKLISDWMIVDNGRLIGGYTIRALREGLSGVALQNFDKGLGGMTVDAGEDYFLPSDSSPEGAIIKLEDAFDADNIEAAIDCKDFNKEAELMLAKMGNIELGQEVVNSTAEVLKLSFLKSLQENGMPKFKGIIRAFPLREKINDDLMVITEVCYYPDGGHSVQKLKTYNGPDGWKVLSPVD